MNVRNVVVSGKSANDASPLKPAAPTVAPDLIRGLAFLLARACAGGGSWRSGTRLPALVTHTTCYQCCQEQAECGKADPVGNRHAESDTNNRRHKD